MTARDNSGGKAKLRMTIRIGEGFSTPLLLRGAQLPAEATHVISNLYKIPARNIDLCFGENEWYTDNVRIGGFNVDNFPLAGQGGPSQLTLKVSVDARQGLCFAILDPVAATYRSIGFMNLSAIEPPPIVRIPPGGASALGFNEIFGAFMDAISDDPAKRSKKHMPRHGKDISCPLAITFEEGLRGTQKHIDVQRAEACPACAGSGCRPGAGPAECVTCQGSGTQRTVRQTEIGTSVSAETCPTCKGTGCTIVDPCTTCRGETKVHIARPFTVDTPSGIDSGAQICILNQGEPGENGGQPGRLYVAVTVADHPLFTRIGRDVSIHLPVRWDFAKRGGQLQVPGLEAGEFFLLNLPPNTRHGSTFRLFQDECCRLSAIVDTYLRYDPIALLRNRKRLQLVRKALMQRELEVKG